MDKITNFIKNHPIIERAFHTFWQSFLAVFMLGITPIFTDIMNGSIDDAKVALMALVAASLATAFSAVKTFVVSNLNTK